MPRKSTFLHFPEAAVISPPLLPFHTFRSCPCEKGQNEADTISQLRPKCTQNKKSDSTPAESMKKSSKELAAANKENLRIWLKRKSLLQNAMTESLKFSVWRPDFKIQAKKSKTTQLGRKTRFISSSSISKCSRFSWAYVYARHSHQESGSKSICGTVSLPLVSGISFSSFMQNLSSLFQPFLNVGDFLSFLQSHLEIQTP